MAADWAKIAGNEFIEKSARGTVKFLETNPDSLNSLLNKESGLKGISGISGDMRAITTAMAEGNQRAKLAFEMYIHRLKSLIGSMIASLEGLDVLVSQQWHLGIRQKSIRQQNKQCFSESTKMHHVSH